jgi:SAM-dependent methyltransferase
MHDGAMQFARQFFDLYVDNNNDVKIVDIGAQDVNGSLRLVAPSNCQYIGVDFVRGKGVDIVLDDPYSLPFEDSSIDVCVCSSCFEHSEFFWLLFNEMIRILKPDGVLYINVPSNGAFHRFPVDCWRFYPDSGIALQNWGRRSGYSVILAESFLGPKQKEGWKDFVGVFVKDSTFLNKYRRRICDFSNVFNVYSVGNQGARDLMDYSEPKRKRLKLKKILSWLNVRAISA